MKKLKFTHEKELWISLDRCKHRVQLWNVLNLDTFDLKEAYLMKETSFLRDFGFSELCFF